MMRYRSIVRARLSTDRAPAGRARHQSHRVDAWTAASISSVVAGMGLGSPLLVVVLPPALFAMRQARTQRAMRRNQRLLDRSVIEVIDRLAQQLRSGRSLAAAVSSLLADIDHGADAGHGLGARLDACRRAHAAGANLGAALRRADVVGLPSLALLATSLRLMLANGGPVALSLDRVGETLRAGVAARDDAAAHAGQATASADLLTLLPVVFTAVVAAIEPAAAQLYLRSWTGAGCLAVAGLLSAASWWWIDRAVQR
ncbi:MAG: type II secretion system F family protein [Acidimicrobiales bacterium]